MDKVFTFDDVLIKPNFSYIKSRKDVDTSCKKLGIELPVVSANMDTITGKEMALAMRQYGGLGCLHRFCTIEENVKSAVWGRHIGRYPMGSIGLGWDELERADALIAAGVELICIDVAHGAQIAVVDQYNALVAKHANIGVIVGNFATLESINQFKSLCKTQPLMFKIGIGPGSACTTRIKTGIGVPQLSAILECHDQGRNSIIADGGLKTPGDIAKALAAGADAVMIGGMLAGTDETPGEGFTIVSSLKEGDLLNKFTHKKYRGSASKESYELQGKSEDWRTAEGESFMVPYKGPVKNVLQDIEGGLRSSLTYVGANDLEEFKLKAQFIMITGNALKENGAHGKI